MMLEDFGGSRWRNGCKIPHRCIAQSLYLCFFVSQLKSEILGRIHAANVIHKDINPSNIVLNPGTGQIKSLTLALPLGLPAPIPASKSSCPGRNPCLPSPEQTGRMNRLLDYRTDFYSLGVTFYELLTGHLPFYHTDMLELHCHIARPPVPPDELNQKFPKLFQI